MNIDKFGRINNERTKDLIRLHEINKLEKMIIVLKTEIIEINSRLNIISDYIIKGGPITLKIKKDGTFSGDEDVIEMTLSNLDEK